MTDGNQAASDGIKAARRAEAETIQAIFKKRLTRLNDYLADIQEMPQRAEDVGATPALMETLYLCAQAQDELDTLVKNMSKYLVLERGQTRNEVAERAHVSAITMGRWIKQAEQQQPQQDHLDLGDSDPLYG